MPKSPDDRGDLKPHFEDVQAHYDLSDDFFRLFLDPTQTYSCAYFERDDMTLEEAQIAKIDLALGKLGLAPGMTLLDIGCGWGATMRRAIERLRRQRRRPDALEEPGRPRPEDVRRDGQPAHQAGLLQGWEQFDEPVDRIVSIGAFEHFGHDRYPDFFKMAYGALPEDGIMLLHTIVGENPARAKELGIPLTFELARFIKFIMTEIFPGGRLPSVPMVEERSAEGGFTCTRKQSLQMHYARTLDIWAAALEARKDEAIAIQSQEVYDRYMKYLTGCAKMFRDRQVDVFQFTLEK